MKAYFFHPENKKLKLEKTNKPQIDSNEVLIEIEACALCRTDLHILDGDLPYKKKPHILGHQIVGVVCKTGSNVFKWKINDRVGVTWLSSTCQTCDFCRNQQENLCSKIRFTGYDSIGGFAEYTKAQQDYLFALPANIAAENLAPLLCAGVIGFRGYEKLINYDHIAIYGFGSAGFLALQTAVKDKKKVSVFTKPNDHFKQQQALKWGASEALGSTEIPQKDFKGSLIFAPVGSLVPHALKHTQKGGHVVCCGIHMSDIPSFPYQDLWNEKTISSIANLTRKSALSYLSKIKTNLPQPLINLYSFEELEKAIEDLRNGSELGSYVIKMK